MIHFAIVLAIVLIFVIMISAISKKDIKIKPKDAADKTLGNETDPAAIETVKIKSKETAENKGIKQAEAIKAGADENAEVEVILKNPGINHILTIKYVLALTKLDLKASKDLVQTVPSVIKKGVPKKEALDFKANVEANGGVVELK